MGHRVVHGKDIARACLVTPDVEKAIRDASVFAPYAPVLYVSCDTPVTDPASQLAPQLDYLSLWGLARKLARYLLSCFGLGQSETTANFPAGQLSCCEQSAQPCQP